MPSHTKSDADGDPTSSTATGTKKELKIVDSSANAYTMAIGENPRNIDYTTKAQCDGCSMYLVPF